MKDEEIKQFYKSMNAFYFIFSSTFIDSLLSVNLVAKQLTLYPHLPTFPKFFLPSWMPGCHRNLNSEYTYHQIVVHELAVKLEKAKVKLSEALRKVSDKENEENLKRFNTIIENNKAQTSKQSFKDPRQRAVQTFYQN